MSQCARCTRPTRDTAVLCHTCGKDLKRTLIHIASLWGALEQAIGKLTRMGNRSDHKPTKASEQPLPVNMHASAVADRARATLTGWTRVLCEDNHLTPPADTIPAICAWLGAHINDMRRHEAAAEMADEITWLSGDITRAVDYPEDRAIIHVGPCPEGEGDPCPGQIHAHVPQAGSTSSPRLECGACGGVWDATQWNRMGARIRRRQAQIDLQRSYGRAG